MIEDFHEGNITKKEKETIKERYTAFNDGFERIVSEQQAYAVPNEVIQPTPVPLPS